MPLADAAIQYARLFGPLRTKFKLKHIASLFLAIPRFDPEHVDLRLRSGR
jgi:hypothetical protein